MKPVVRETIYTEDEARERLAYWQKILRLRDWNIMINIVRARDMNLPTVSAEINYVLDHKIAKINLVNPDDYPPGSWLPQDMDWDIVHELLHLHFLRVQGEDVLDTEAEQSIESITYGLMRLEREKRK